METKEEQLIYRKYVSLDDIIEIVSKFTDIPMERICAPGRNVKTRLYVPGNRQRNLVIARQLCHYFAKIFTRLSLAEIGWNVGFKDHATVLHSCKTIKNLVETDKKFRIMHESILENLEQIAEMSEIEVKVCSSCGSKDIMQQRWIGVNNKKIGALVDPESNIVFCIDCQSLTVMTDLYSYKQTELNTKNPVKIGEYAIK